MKRWLLLTCLVSFIGFIPCRAHAKIYHWTDDKGVAHFTNDENKIPAAYRDKVAVSDLSNKSDKKAQRTVVHFERKGSSVLVNAVLNYKLPVVFHLDTGATETLITYEDASKLGLDLENAPKVRTRLADGSKVEFSRVRLKSLSVGEAQVRDLDVLVGQTRLLGLSFLKQFKLTIDSEHGQLVLENPTHLRELESPEVAAEKEHLIVEYEAKQEKLKLSVEQVQKNIALLESEIDSLENRQLELEENITSAYQQGTLQLNIGELEAVLQRLQLALESRQLQIESYKKDIEILENNIDYYQNWINKFQ